jgi:aryl-alcohol dehydrogenase-like predicted oxidoreductase
LGIDLEIVLGTAQLTRQYGAVSRREDALTGSAAADLILKAESLGFKAIDTAPGYGNAETIIGNSGTNLAIHTKFVPELDPIHSLDLSLKKLCLDSVDVVYFHDSKAAVASNLSEIRDIKDALASKAKSLGASIYTESEFLAALEHPSIDIIQIPLNVMDRQFGKELRKFAIESNKQIFVRSIFLQGLLISQEPRAHRVPDGLEPYLKQLDELSLLLQIPNLDLAMGWILSLPYVSGVIVGVNRIDDLQAIGRAISRPALDSETISLLEMLDLPPRNLVDPRNWTF